MIHFITYGSNEYKITRKTLLAQAKTCPWFDSVKGYGEEDLCPEFKKKFSEILSSARGGGYWCWKPHIIKRRMSEINDGDFLVYLDAGCRINQEGKKRFYEYIKMIDESEYGVMSFQMIHPEKCWTTKEIFDYFNIERDSDFGNSGQYVATAVIFKKNEHGKKIINEWEKSLIEKPLLWTNDYNHNQIECFKENRHDQSFLSLIRKINGSVVINSDETWTPTFGEGESMEFPFWAQRIK